MFQQLRELFPEFVFLDWLSVREFLHYELDYDIVFSPVSLETDKKLFICKPILRTEDKQRIRKQVMLEVYDYIPNEINVDDLMAKIQLYANISDKRVCGRNSMLLSTGIKMLPLQNKTLQQKKRIYMIF